MIWLATSSKAGTRTFKETRILELIWSVVGQGGSSSFFMTSDKIDDQRLFSMLSSADQRVCDCDSRYAVTVV